MIVVSCLGISKKEDGNTDLHKLDQLNVNCYLTIRNVEIIMKLSHYLKLSCDGLNAWSRKLVGINDCIKEEYSSNLNNKVKPLATNALVPHTFIIMDVCKNFYDFQTNEDNKNNG